MVYHLQTPLEVGVKYNVNVFAVVEVKVSEGESEWEDSQPLFGKIIKEGDLAISADTDVDTDHDQFDFPTTSRIRKISIIRYNGKRNFLERFIFNYYYYLLLRRRGIF